MGKPDLALQLPEYAMPADPMEETKEFTIATSTTEPRWVRAVDLLPGHARDRPQRDHLREGRGCADTGAPAPEQSWRAGCPGRIRSPATAAPRTVFPPARNSRPHSLQEDVSYESKPMTDRSTVGVYFAQASTAQKSSRCR